MGADGLHQGGRNRHASPDSDVADAFFGHRGGSDEASDGGEIGECALSGCDRGCLFLESSGNGHVLHEHIRNGGTVAWSDAIFPASQGLARNASIASCVVDMGTLLKISACFTAAEFRCAWRSTRTLPGDSEATDRRSKCGLHRPCERKRSSTRDHRKLLRFARVAGLFDVVSSRLFRLQRPPDHSRYLNWSIAAVAPWRLNLI